jgi:hypothetical protein
MSETNPNVDSSMRGMAGAVKKRGQGRQEGEDPSHHEEEEKRNANGVSGTAFPFAGEMERRGEEKVRAQDKVQVLLMMVGLQEILIPMFGSYSMNASERDIKRVRGSRKQCKLLVESDPSIIPIIQKSETSLMSLLLPIEEL